MNKKSKILIETDSSEDSDELTCAGNTWLRMNLERGECTYNLNIIVSSRLDTDNYTTMTLVGISPKGIDTIIGQLSEIRNRLVKNIK